MTSVADSPTGPRVAIAVVVVPAFNEERAIGDVVRGLRAHGHRVVVVDDGSSDGTHEEALRAGAVTIRHPVNRGQGAALQTGILHGLRLGARYLVTFDADGQHEAGDIDALLRSLEESGADVALGSRFLGQARDIGRGRRILLRCATVFTNWTSGVRLTDAHNGLRAMTAEAARVIRIRQDGMAHASEIVQQLRAHGLRHVEVPVTVYYTAYSRSKGQSGFAALSVLYNLLVGRIR